MTAPLSPPPASAAPPRVSVVIPCRNEAGNIGPLIDEKGVAKVEDHIARTVAAGGKVLTGGQRIEGNFFQPTVTFGGDDELFCHEETFGPVAALLPIDDEAEAVKAANATEYGLASYVFTEDISRALRIGDRINGGTISEIGDSRITFVKGGQQQALSVLGGR